MGLILKLAGGLALIRMLLGKAAGSISSRFEWKFLPFQRGDFQPTIEEGQLKGRLKIRFQVINRNSINLALQGFQAVISQAGQRLGEVNSTSLIQLPTNELKQLTIELEINSKDLVNRFDSILKKGGLVDPIRIQGDLLLNNGQVIPVSHQLNFFSING